jgi:hypothetical protein
LSKASIAKDSSVRRHDEAVDIHFFTPTSPRIPAVRRAITALLFPAQRPCSPARDRESFLIAAFRHIAIREKNAADHSDFQI